MLKLLLLAFLQISMAQSGTSGSPLGGPTGDPTVDDICSGPRKPGIMMRAFKNVIETVKDEQLSYKEADAIWEHPWASLKAKNLSGEAHADSNMLCYARLKKASKLPDTEDNEMEALRHFITAVRLADQYPDEAYKILFAHDARGNALTTSDLMDIRNNRLGIEYAAELAKEKNKLTREEVHRHAVERGLQMIRDQKLSVITPVTYGPCSRLKKATDAEIRGMMEKHFETKPDKIRNCDFEGTPERYCGINTRKR